jgi:predicted N-formylglutamate amidohydrolase
MLNTIILSCEHAGNNIPEEYEYLFHGREQVLTTHRGIDIGAYNLGQQLSKSLHATLFYTDISRLVVEANRSAGTPDLFSEFTHDLPDEEKQDILVKYYYPYRDQVEDVIRDHISKGDVVLHLSLHSFTPVLNGDKRTTDIGLLYDPERSLEREFCSRWEGEILKTEKTLKVKHNYPYLGTSDGFTTYLRSRLPEDKYLGIELEVNQKFPEQENPHDWENLKKVITESLRNTVKGFNK